MIEETVFPADYDAQKDELELCGQETTELLDYEPPRLIKRRIIRPKFRRKTDRQLPPLIAPAMPTPLETGVPTFGLVTELIISKFADHLPIYRQQNIFQRLGLHAPRDTLNYWTLESLELLRPIAEAVHHECLSKNYLQVDETPIKQLAPGTGKTRTSYVWAFNDPCPDGSVSFRWEKGRRRTDLDHALGDFYGAWEGCLQTDGYQAYTSYQRDHADLVDLNNCTTHIRRGFKKAFDLGERDAARVIKLLSYVYQLEAQMREEKAGPALRHAIRASHVAPRLRLIRKYLERIRFRHFPGSEMAKAITYALNHWDRFKPYLTDGRVELCNNLIENAIRPLKLGAKNYLFFGSARGGELACVAYTLIENCKRHGLDLRGYLIEAMKMLVEHGPGRASELTPAAVAGARRMRKVS